MPFLKSRPAPLLIAIGASDSKTVEVSRVSRSGRRASIKQSKLSQPPQLALSRALAGNENSVGSITNISPHMKTFGARIDSTTGTERAELTPPGALPRGDRYRQVTTREARRSITTSKMVVFEQGPVMDYDSDLSRTDSNTSTTSSNRFSSFSSLATAPGKDVPQSSLFFGGRISVEPKAKLEESLTEKAEYKANARVGAHRVGGAGRPVKVRFPGLKSAFLRFNNREKMRSVKVSELEKHDDFENQVEVPRSDDNWRIPIAGNAVTSVNRSKKGASQHGSRGVILQAATVQPAEVIQKAFKNLQSVTSASEVSNGVSGEPCNCEICRRSRGEEIIPAPIVQGEVSGAASMISTALRIAELVTETSLPKKDNLEMYLRTRKYI